MKRIDQVSETSRDRAAGLLGAGLLLLGAVLLAPSPVRAAEPTALEIVMLPPYCQARLSGDRAAMEQWSAALGKEVHLHIHHYCYGLVYVNRANQTFEQRKRRYLLNQAISEFDYVLKRWPPTSTLYAEAQGQKALAQMLEQP
ncbi:hypothetical protein L0E83_00775 [Marichromatium gracile]|uniref:hypothetical protein n=1 Tax=Marichromatium gracile TaxID=1048 RepID=UPI001F423CA0|nr:hypothetical protein [Marichromatium gracile]MCF1181970.1 hypothetical protein [Marichromatium gracile]